MGKFLTKRRVKSGAIVLALALAGAVGFGWDAPAAVQAALLGGCITLLTAIGGVFVISWQLGEQGANTIRANRDNEAMKLKKEIYQSAIETCDEASEALQAVGRYALDGWVEVSEMTILMKQKQTLPASPIFSINEMNVRYERARVAVGKLAGLTENWRIVEPKISLFAKAFELSGELRGGSYAGFLTGAYVYLSPTDGKWELSDRSVEIFRRHMEALHNEVLNEAAYIFDFRVTMQNALLGDLFDGRRLEMRKPRNESSIVIDIDKYDEVTARLDKLRSTTSPFDTAKGLASLSTPP